MRRRWLFPLLVLAVALAAWLLEDRLGLRPRPAPTVKHVPPAPDPHDFDMRMRPAPAAPPKPPDSPPGK